MRSRRRIRPRLAWGPLLVARGTRPRRIAGTQLPGGPADRRYRRRRLPGRRSRYRKCADFVGEQVERRVIVRGGWLSRHWKPCSDQQSISARGDVTGPDLPAEPPVRVDPAPAAGLSTCEPAFYARVRSRWTAAPVGERCRRSRAVAGLPNPTWSGRDHRADRRGRHPDTCRRCLAPVPVGRGGRTGWRAGLDRG